METGISGRRILGFSIRDSIIDQHVHLRPLLSRLLRSRSTESGARETYSTFTSSQGHGCQYVQRLVVASGLHECDHFGQFIYQTQIGCRIEIWFFIGALLGIYGLLILVTGIFNLFHPPEKQMALSHLHPDI